MIGPGSICSSNPKKKCSSLATVKMLTGSFCQWTRQWLAGSERPHANVFSPSTRMIIAPRNSTKSFPARTKSSLLQEEPTFEHRHPRSFDHFLMGQWPRHNLSRAHARVG